MPTPEQDDSGAHAAEAVRGVGEGFTDWGQFGPAGFDLRVFEQQEVWVTQAGRPRALAAMSDSEVADLADYLAAHVNHFYVECLRRDVLAALVDSFTSGAEGAPDVAVGAGRDPGRLLRDMTPRQWLAQTPLMMALRLRGATDRSPGDAPGGQAGGVSGGPVRSSVTDGDVGLWAVVTGTSCYVLDLDGRAVLRAPGHGAEPLRTDCRWQSLVTVRRCRVRERLLLVLRGGDGLPRPVASTSEVVAVRAGSTVRVEGS